jgi:hypothetical protein
MSKGDWFIAAVILLQLCATVTYFAQGKWKDGLVWFGVVVSNAAYLSLARG